MLNVKEIEHKKPDIYNQSKLILEISGDDVNYSLINSLRIVCYGEIPIYGFETENINIKYNDTIVLDACVIGAILTYPAVVNVDNPK